MRNDSIFYKVTYKEITDTSDKDDKVKSEAIIEFNDNIVLTGIEAVEKTKHPGIYSVKIEGKKEFMDIPEMALTAHLDAAQLKVETQWELIKLVKDNEETQVDNDKA